MSTHTPEPLVYENRNGLTHNNPSEWRKEGFWRGNKFLGGAGSGWDDNYEAPSEELQKEITTCVNALAGRDPSKLADLEKAAERLSHWSRQYIMAIERQFGPQPRYGCGIVGSLISSIDECNAALAAFRKEAP